MSARGRCLWVGLLASMFACAAAAEKNGGNQVEAAALQEAAELNETVIKLYEEGRYREAIPLAARALAIRAKALGLEDPDTLRSLNNLALLYHSTGVYAKATPLYARALATVEK